MYQLNNIINTINTINFVSDVKISGSLHNSTNDHFSDIDLTVSIKNIPADKALLQITETLEHEYKPLWKDFARSLMPQKFLVSMFFNCDNPFSFIDIGIFNNSNDFSFDPNLFTNDKWIHLTKLWIMNFKYFIRRSDNFQERFTRMMSKANITYYKNHSDGFRLLLDCIAGKNTVSNIYIQKLYKALYEYGQF